MTALELEMEVAEIKTRLVEVERVVRKQLGELDVGSPPAKLPVSNAELLDWLRQQGLVREPTPDELHMAEMWNQRTEEEKQAVLWELDHLPPGPKTSVTQLNSLNVTPSKPTTPSNWPWRCARTAPWRWSSAR